MWAMIQHANGPFHRHIWESGADGAFAISEDTEGKPLGRGTQINIYLKVHSLLLEKAGSKAPAAGMAW